MLDVTVDDARAVNEFFALTDLFTFEYFRGTDYFLRDLGANRCLAARQEAITALENFREAREAFLETHGTIEVARLIVAGDPARKAFLTVTTNEKNGSGHMVTVSLEMLANSMQKAEAGPLLIVLLVRGVSVVPVKAWA